MIAKRLLQTNLVVSSVVAFSFVFFPRHSLALYGISGDIPLLVIAQYFGSAHVAFAVVLLLAIRTNEVQLMRMLVVSFFAGDLVGSVVLVAAQLRGAMNLMGWGLVGLSALFAVGYGYCAIRKLPSSK
jgi:hypothetical protein